MKIFLIIILGILVLFAVAFISTLIIPIATKTEKFDSKLTIISTILMVLAVIDLVICVPIYLFLVAKFAAFIFYITIEIVASLYGATKLINNRREILRESERIKRSRSR